MGLRANRREKVADCWSSCDPGDFSYTKRQGLEGIFGMVFVCPCGCKAVASISFQNAPEEAVKWTWNGDEEKPTLSPSLHNLECGWHGFLRNGIFEAV